MARVQTTTVSGVRKVELPHAESYEAAALARRNVVASRSVSIAGVDLAYQLFRATPELSEPGLYDEHGVVYVSAELVESSPVFADLIAFHETVEIREKTGGIWHGEAHRRAYVEELLGAEATFAHTELAHYLEWRIGMYPTWKGLEVDACVAELLGVLDSDAVDERSVYESVARYNL